MPLALLSVLSPVENPGLKPGDKGGFAIRISPCHYRDCRGGTPLGKAARCEKPLGELVALWGWHRWWPGREGPAGLAGPSVVGSRGGCGLWVYAGHPEGSGNFLGTLCLGTAGPAQLGRQQRDSDVGGREG